MIAQTIDHATDIEIDGVGFRHLVTTRHGNVTARTVVHTTHLPKRLGGVRFVERGSVEEVAHLALGMSGKAAAADVPIDGLKCLIQCPDGVPASVSERATLVAAHLRLARQVDTEIIFGPDMFAAESVLSRVADDPDLARHVTGLDRSHGGIDIDGNGLTARGILEAIVTADSGGTPARINIQGFGAVGAELARMLPNGYVVCAISNRLGLIRDDRGLDVTKYHRSWKESGDSWICAANDRGVEQSADIDSILTLPCDILVPAARTAAIACSAEVEHFRRENPAVTAVERMLEAGPPTMIAEAANFPLTEAAEDLLEDAGSLVLPDILVNCGGMIGCWHEYDNRRRLLDDPSEYARSLEACLARIGDVVRRNTQAVLDGRRDGRHARAVARLCARRSSGKGA